MNKLPYQGIVPAVAISLCLLAGCGAGSEKAPVPKQPALSGHSYVYFGTYTRGKSGSRGVYVSKLDLASGKLTQPGLAAESPNPSFVALHPNGWYLYAVSETSGTDGKPAGAVSAFAVDRRSGLLTHLNTVASRGNGPCHLMADHTGKCLVVTNYGSGSVASFPIQTGGSLGKVSSFFQHTGSSVNPKRQKGPHAHSVNISPDNRFAIVADLGLDRLFVYKLDAAKATLAPNDPPFATVAPGSGPRHFNFHPNGKYGYAINEMASTVTAFAWDAAGGKLTEIETLSTLPNDFKGTSTSAEVLVHPSGKFLYGSNRGDDSIAIFAIDPATGKLTPVDHVSTQGKTPRSFGIDPTGNYLIAANQVSNNIVAFRIDQETGKLTPTGQQLKLDAPVCVRYLQID